MTKARRSIYDIGLDAGYNGGADYPEAHGLSDLSVRGRNQFNKGYYEGCLMARAAKARASGGAK